MEVGVDLVLEDAVVIWQMEEEKGPSRWWNSKRRGSEDMRPGGQRVKRRRKPAQEFRQSVRSEEGHDWIFYLEESLATTGRPGQEG